MISALKTETHEHEAGDDEGRREPDYREAGFGFQDARVSTHVDRSCEVVQPVAGELAEESCYDGSEVEESWRAS